MTFGIEPFKTKKAKTVQCEGADINSGDEEEAAEDAEETATAKNVLKLLTDFLDSEVGGSFSSTVMKHLQPVFIFLALFFYFYQSLSLTQYYF